MMSGVSGRRAQFDVDALLCSDFGFTVGWWIEAARKLGNTAAEKLSLEW